MSNLPSTITATPFVARGQRLPTNRYPVRGTAFDYPPKAGREVPVRTYASYDKQSIPELATEAQGSWNLCLPIPIPPEPDLYNPTLSSLAYVVKYATSWANGGS